MQGFTDRLFDSRAKDASGEHELDLLRENLGIDYTETIRQAGGLRS